MPKPENRGGKRKGAGRPPTSRRLGRPGKSKSGPVITSFFRREHAPNDADVAADASEIQPTAPLDPSPPSPQPTHPINQDTTMLEEDINQMGKITGTLRESMAAITSKYQEKATKLVQAGQLWTTRSKEFVPQSTISRDALVDGSCWKSFYQYDVFTWRPDLMVSNGKQWTPRCISCNGENVKARSYNRPPRFVYGLEKNYILNSPVQWECADCAVKSAAEAAAFVPKKERTPYLFTSHHVTVLEELAAAHPGVYHLFPCHLSPNAGLDKQIVELAIKAATSGMGVTAVRDYITISHNHHWHCRYVLYLEFLKDRKNNPHVMDHGFNEQLFPNLASSFPEYESSDLCGRVPSDGYLLRMFNAVTEKQEKWMDSLHQRRLADSRIIAFDCSYKAPKWLANYDGEKLYGCLATAKNEYHESIMCAFSQSDNFDEIGSALSMLRHGGLNPDFSFTDNPGRDQRLFDGTWPSLEAVPELPEEAKDLLALRGEPLYLHQQENAVAALQIFEHAVISSDEVQKVVSFDTEHSVYGDGTTSKIAVVSMASAAYDSVLVFHLSRMRNVPRELLDRIRIFFERDELTFAGSNIKGDVTKLQNDFPSIGFSHRKMLKIYDTNRMAEKRLVSTEGFGLDVLCRKLLGFNLPKETAVRVSSKWDSPLDDEALSYAARDAEAGVQVYKKLAALPDLSVRLSKGETKPGVEVDIMLQRKTALDPVATGRIVQVDGRSIGGTKLDPKDWVRVEVTKIYKPNAMLVSTEVNRRRCSCRQQKHSTETHIHCNMRSFGAAEAAVGLPFTIVENRKKLRLQQPFQQTVAPANDANEFPRVETILENQDEEVGDGSGGETEVGDSLAPPSIDLPEDCLAEIDRGLEQGERDPLTEDDRGLEEDDQDPSGEGSELLASPGAPLFGDDDPDDDIDPDNERNDWSGVTPRQSAIAKSTQSVVDALIEQAGAGAIRSGVDSIAEAGLRAILRRVLGDCYHIMDRIKVPVHHEWKASYYSCYRDAIFIYDEDDKKAVEKVLQKKGMTWEQTVRTNFRYISRRVRRLVPPPKVLKARVKAVFDYFGDKKDSTTGKPLFNERAKKLAKNVLLAIERGDISDPPGVSFYFRMIDQTTNQPKVDKDGLPLWRCVRGTGSAECAHSQYTRCFGQVRAGPIYSVSVLKHHHHRQSMRASSRYRPNFPFYNHYDCQLIDATNALHFDLTGSPKDEGWPGHDEVACVGRSPFGIIPLLEDTSRKSAGPPCPYITPSEQFIAAAQGSDLPHTPVTKSSERFLFKKLIEESLKNGVRLSARQTFVDMARVWNSEYVKVPTSSAQPVKILPKYVGQLVSYYRLWRIRSKRSQTFEAAAKDPAIRALRYNRGITVADPMEAATLGPMKSARSKEARRAPPPKKVTVTPAPFAPRPPPYPPRPTPIALPPWLLHPQWAPPPLQHAPPPLPKKRKVVNSKICTVCNKAACRRPFSGRGICTS